MEQSLEAKCVLGNVELNSTFLIDDESVSFQQEGYVIVKVNIFSNRKKKIQQNLSNFGN